MNRCTNEIMLLDQCLAVIRLAHLLRTDYLWIVRALEDLDRGQQKKNTSSFELSGLN